ncbi:N-acetyltransferase family protein [Corynebacterium urogenitale]
MSESTEMTEIQLRPATEADRPFLEDMFREADTWGTDRPLSENFDDDLKKYVGTWDESQGGVIVEKDGTPIGATWLLNLTSELPGSGYVKDDIPELAIAMARGNTGAGLGRMLLNAALATARDAGKPGVSLAVDKGNDRAYHVYEKLGFVEVDYNKKTDCHVMLYDFAQHEGDMHILSSQGS